MPRDHYKSLRWKNKCKRKPSDIKREIEYTSSTKYKRGSEISIILGVIEGDIKRIKWKGSKYSYIKWISDKWNKEHPNWKIKDVDELSKSEKEKLKKEYFETGE